MWGQAGGVQKPLAIPGPASAGLYCGALCLTAALRLAVKKYKLFPSVLALCLGLQVASLVVVPVVVLVVRWRNRNKAVEERAFQREAVQLHWLPSLTTAGGAAFVLGGLWLLSATLTEIEIWQLASACECLAFAALGLRTALSRSVVGLSGQKLALDALRLGCRIAAMAWMGRRLPRKSADGVVQAFDVASFLLVAALLYCSKVALRGTYQHDLDKFRVWPPALACCAAALVLRASISQILVLDALWTASLYLDAVAQLPQLALVAQNGGTVDAAMGHHLAGVFVSRLLGLAFWWSIRGTWHGGRAATGWGLLAVYAAQLVLLSHYMCYYFKGCLAGGLLAGSPMVCAE